MNLKKYSLFIMGVVCGRSLIAMDALDRKQEQVVEEVHEPFVQMKQNRIQGAKLPPNLIYQAAQKARVVLMQIEAINKEIDETVKRKKAIKDAVRPKEEKEERLTALRKMEAELKKERETKYASLKNNDFLHSKEGRQLKDELYKAAHKR